MAGVRAVLAPAFLVSLVLLRPVRGQDEKKPNDEPYLTAIGGLAASTSYFAYKRVETVSEDFDKGVYTADQTKKLMGEVVNLLKLNATQLEGVRKIGRLPEGEAKVFEDFIVLFGELQEYAKTVQDYTQGKTKEHADAMQEARKKTSSHIKKALGIK